MGHSTLSPLLTFIGHSSFRATFKGSSSTIRSGAKCTVQIEFIPEFEGKFEATLQFIFEGKQGQFVVSRKLEAMAGSLEDHKRFESLNQDNQDIPRSWSVQQIPPEKIISLGMGDQLEYELPPLVQEAVNRATPKRPYDKKAPGLIAYLKPRELTIDTYGQFFTALLNVEEGHQL